MKILQFILHWWISKLKFLSDKAKWCVHHFTLKFCSFFLYCQYACPKSVQHFFLISSSISSGSMLFFFCITKQCKRFLFVFALMGLLVDGISSEVAAVFSVELSFTQPCHLSQWLCTVRKRKQIQLSAIKEEETFSEKPHRIQADLP